MKEKEFNENELAEIKQAQRDYKKKWRKNNKEKIKLYNQRYWLKKAKIKSIELVCGGGEND